MSDQAKILKVLEAAGDWIVSYELVKRETPWGYLGISSLQRCRELVKSGEIEKNHEGGFVWYRKLGEPEQSKLNL